ncbi:hypothetical protein ABK040_010382 [Willaertia magna]
MPKITDYSVFLSTISKLRKPSPIRALAPLMNLPGMISLAGGLPNENTFPFISVNVGVKNQEGVETINLSGQSLSTALQYHPSQGLPSFVSWFRKHQETTHHLLNDDKKQIWDTICTTGSQDALSKAFEMFLDAGSETDAIIVERPTYSGALATLQVLRPKMIEVDVDAHGIIPEIMEERIVQFKKENPNAVIKFLYCIPNGQNPSGCSLTLERKKKIYELSQTHNFIILEDDPYYYMALGKEEERVIVPSFLEMDQDGRVLRFDSLSKVLSSGLRIGFCTGPIQLINQMVLHIQASNLHSSGLSQAVAGALLEKWGEEGFLKHLAFIRQFYTQKRDDFIECVEKYLSSYVEYSVPVCGMFVWMKLKGIPDSLKFIEEKARKEMVLMLPGTYFFATPNTVTPYIRASFSTASKQDMEEACRRLAKLLEEETATFTK